MKRRGNSKNSAGYIAVFDSGIGGLTVLRHLQAALPQEKFLYFADQAHIPYGQHTPQQVTQFSEAISDFLLKNGAKLLVVACNTATAAALTYLRGRFPAVPFVGMEPAVKPAANSTQTKTVGVLATQGTFMSERYAALMAAYGTEIRVIENPCIGLVEMIERGEIGGTAVYQLLESIIQPMLAQNADTIVLGCTHYPFVRPYIEQIAGAAVRIIDPAPAVAQQARRLLFRHHFQNEAGPPLENRFVTTGSAARFSHQLEQLGWGVLSVETARLLDGRITLENQV